MVFRSSHFLPLAISYLFFFALVWVAKVYGANRLIAQEGILSTNRRWLLFLHGGGLLAFGVFPFFSSHSDAFLFRSTQPFWPTLVTMFLFFVVSLASYRLAEKEWKGWNRHKVIFSRPDLQFLVIYFSFRIFFITAYELWFRGFLLNDTVQELGTAAAIFLNVFLYAIIHTVNGKEEMIGCIPFGFVLCLLCVWQGAVWPAILLHLALTLTYEMTLLKKQTTKTYQHERFYHGSLRVHRP